MKKVLLILIGIIIFFFLTITLFIENYRYQNKKHSLVAQSNKNKWISIEYPVHYEFAIDSFVDRRFYGRIISEKKDTIQLSGFEKGNNHPTWTISNGDSKMLFIEMHTKFADTIFINNIDSIDVLPLYLEMKKTLK